ncbi:BREX-2 system adenine-specific DNA-methyltransferase PglX [Prauserella halophila]|uniref:site-specific DNA-methyltransferase (adenine-specific) n=1 Tax=Prauserella halophila TaxID=185641 RepID=A0ABN1W051_9PSEU|nr:BREX-2 system adenine-specific DNA-methyltransferase PglX [Prauserella halophila]MCP2235247.1 Methyltransferase domain-containing protein [Prauserella halophila]
MAKVTGLVGALQRQVEDLEQDLRARVDGPDEFARDEGVFERWYAEYEAALKSDRTAASWQAWRDERVTQVAVAWVLVTVFARFCEDNRLVSRVWIAGPDRTRRQDALDARDAYFQEHPEHNDRHWLLQIVEHFAGMRATAGLVDGYSPLWQVSPSGDAALRLLQFWWDQDSEGELLWRFGPEVNPELDTRFLGDLYQDLSEFAQEHYALLQTPEFVEEFILDQTFEPALAERQLDGFTVIDPTCGSGHFLLGAFDRLVDRWSKQEPNLDTRTLVQKALDGVRGVDINPFAVAIARFRLIVAALKATGDTSLEHAPDFHTQLAAGDSLIYGAKQTNLHGDLFSTDTDGDTYAYATENATLLKKILHDHYDVVVGNPPYITAKDKAQNSAYRALYGYCKGKYALTVPFMELFFNLARSGDRPGWTGQITSNSFMKREFGTPIIEKFLANKDLRSVIDTSGAYIPGHGTPTVILIGRNQGKVDDTARAVLGVRGEPGRPEDPAKGLVWSSIVNHVDDPGFENDWVTVANLDRSALNGHPWSLAGGGAVELSEAIQENASNALDSVIASAGITAVTGEDDFFMFPTARDCDRIGWGLTTFLVEGEYVRDWDVDAGLQAAGWTYDEAFKVKPLEELGSLGRWLQMYKSVLDKRKRFGVPMVERGLAWYEWQELYLSKFRSELSIAFAFVATHNHFVLDRGGKVFKQSAPVMKLPEGASEDDHLELLGVLNSSVACFWLKQNSHGKGNGGVNEGFRGDEWDEFYEFTGTTLKDFPLPAEFPLERARRLDTLAQELARHTPQAVAEAGVPTKQALDAAYAEHERIRAQLIAEQEELDWECYRLYGLVDEDLTYSGELPGLSLGERAFEIVLARAMAEGEHTAWFERHRSTPITESPEHWTADYRDLVQRRLDLIASDRNIRLLEKPEHKRRWQSDPWDKRVRTALRDWLLDRLEDRSLWFDKQNRPRPRSIAQLADLVGTDAEFTGVLELWMGQPDVDTSAALQQLVDDQAVPFLAAYRYKESGLTKRAAWEDTWRLQRLEDDGAPPDKPIPVPPKYSKADFQRGEYWQHRGKLDVPKERFISYPDAGRETDPTPLLGWAGWDHAQQALAVATIMNEREQEGWTDEQLLPLIAGLAELQPWVRQWHHDTDPNYGVSLASFVDEELATRCTRAGTTAAELAAWRPAKPVRRKRKTTTAKAQQNTAKAQQSTARQNTAQHNTGHGAHDE